MVRGRRAECETIDRLLDGARAGQVEELDIRAPIGFLLERVTV